MNTTNYIRIFRGDDSDALGYQTIVGTIKTDLDLAGCKAVFRFLGFYAEFNPIPDDKKLTIVIPAQASRGFPPGVGYASLKVFDSLGKIRTFTNRIPVIVDTMTPSCGCGEFEVSFSPFPELEPLKIFIGPNADDFDQYTGFVSKIIDRASLVKYGLVMLADAMSEDGGADGKAASPLAVKAAYDAIIKELTDNYYTAEETDEAINSVAAYYITRNAAGDAFETKAQLDSATVFYSGGKVRTPTRNDYCVVLADETHGNAEYRYIYAVAEEQTTGSWQPQFPVGGIMTIDSSVTKNSSNPVTSSGIWAALWGALPALPTGFTSLYDWVVDRLSGYKQKQSPVSDPAVGGVALEAYAITSITQNEDGVIAPVKNYLPTAAPTELAGGQNGLMSAADKSKLDAVTVLTSAQLAKIAAVSSATAFDAAKVGGYEAGEAVVYEGVLYTFTEAHTGAWTGTDVDAVDVVALINALAAAKANDNAVVHLTGNETVGGVKTFDSEGVVVHNPQTGFSIKLLDTGFAVTNGYDTVYFYVPSIAGGGGTFALLSDVTSKADRDESATSGNLAKFDSQGNPIDSLIPAANIAVKADLRYTLTTKTIDNNAVTLDDRAINAVEVSSSLASLTVNFPTATSGKVRDFGLRLTVASGVTTAPQIVLPQGVVCENADGTAPEIGADGAATILYFTETASGVFLVKGEVVTAIS